MKAKGHRSRGRCNTTPPWSRSQHVPFNWRMHKVSFYLHLRCQRDGFGCNLRTILPPLSMYHQHLHLGEYLWPPQLFSVSFDAMKQKAKGMSKYHRWTRHDCPLWWSEVLALPIWQVSTAWYSEKSVSALEIKSKSIIYIIYNCGTAYRPIAYYFAPNWHTLRMTVITAEYNNYSLIES